MNTHPGDPGGYLPGLALAGLIIRLLLAPASRNWVHAKGGPPSDHREEQ